LRNRIKEKSKLLLFTVGMIALLGIGSTFSFLKLEVEKTNNLTAHNTDVEIKEKFPDNPKTGKDVTKEVEFVNKGSSSVFLRMSYTEYWQAGGADTGNLLSNQVGNVDVAVKNWNKSFNPLRESSNWVSGSDGWYYYKKVLKSGASTGLVLDSVSFQNFAAEEFQDYKKADYHLYFRTEVVQCSDGSGTLNKDAVNEDATKTVFGKKGQIQQDGITVTWEN